eukprot:CAMPEP_0116883858 /NCGR_PEP_ID=MMETSP0463-20121206/16527_1 /TAXON_ID=181622 /ORGANISM="Strombidinopsis sp, Strain SopsisLIS2011" /LENGTH=226 /DNA_ID=CAMNT_0004539337 /DNA_START=270 /DNA_END=951 /DNA_ORIENTATION=-
MSNWAEVSGDHLQTACNIDKFVFVNDFAAAGHGICKLEPSHYHELNENKPVKDQPKIVIGPGTGLGQAYLTKSKFAPCYEVFPSEGGHAEFSPRSDEDLELMKFAYTYLKESDNIENVSVGKGEVSRVSVQRVCAGPGVPLLYEFYKSNNPELAKILEDQDGKYKLKTQEIRSAHVIEAALQHNDPLCMIVVKKFVEIFAVETGDFALKALPLGGVYICGGVADGI